MKLRSPRMLMAGTAAALVVPLAGWGAGSALSQASGSASPESSGQGSHVVQQAGTSQAGTMPKRSSGDREPPADRQASTAPKQSDSVSKQSDSGQQQASAGNPATLEGIAVKPGDGSHDRVVFDFSGPVPEHVAEYLESYPQRPGSGKTVEMSGQLFLQLNFRHSTVGENVPKVVEANLPNVAEVRYLGGFEKVQEAAIGVNSCHGAPKRAPFEVTTRGNDIVVDVGTPNCGTQEPQPSECGDVAFSPQSDHGAFGITATGVGCDKARDVAAAAEGRLGKPYGTSGGFSCLVERDDSGQLTSYDYTCTRAEATVTFTAS